MPQKLYTCLKPEVIAKYFVGSLTINAFVGDKVKKQMGTKIIPLGELYHDLSN
jgi:hypothetical protein